MSKLLAMMMNKKYTRLEYIESTGTQYIDTGVKSSSDLIVDTEYYYESGYFFGYNGTIDGVNKSYGYPSNTNNSYLRIGSGYVFQNSEWGTNKWLNLHIENSRNDVTLNGVTFSNSGGGFGTHTFSNGGNIILGRYADTNFVGKIKYFNIKQNGVFIRQLIPVLRKSDNELGMLDLVEGKFYPNAGTGKFTANLDTMYAIIQGTPTVQDGRVSGFSADNYLKTSLNYTTNNMNDHNYEFLVKFTPSSTWGSECYAIKYYNNSVVRGIGLNGGKLSWAVGHPNTSGHTIRIESDFNAVVGTTYWLKGIYQNKIASLYYSLDGKNYTLIGSVDETDQTFQITSSFNIGATANDSYGLFRGTIDLNRSYIKIDNTKYSLQAVVGYTVVGSPTITDGVVSGFSSSDYLQIAQTINLVSKNNYEIQVGVILTSNAPAGVAFTVSSAYVDGIQFNDNKFRFQARESNGSTRFYLDSSYTLQTNKTYICNVKRKENSITMTLYEDSILVETVSEDLTNITFNQANLNYRLGQNNFMYLENANIVLNSTYIKINNKLWFNGNPA